MERYTRKIREDSPFEPKWERRLDLVLQGAIAMGRLAEQIKEDLNNSRASEKERELRRRFR